MSTEPLIRSFPAHPSTLADIRTFVRKQAAQGGFTEAAANDLALAVSEACANSIVHAATATILVTWRLQEDRTEVEVQDEGIFRKRVPMPELDGAGGHGIPLMMALMDEVVVREGTQEDPGTLVRLIKYRNKRRRIRTVTSGKR
jgi:anti-sigma regulatory factor (Ser/Thr protein kinase)